ncbi:MAG: heme-copper oxidase subunit III [Candidatus Latescibacteria bacterium]|jgi:heme/copper-type cytochrome/quinol oxidase subunit 3|nr:heme-copper oxidase subunit III [Candidatus Latescibacterota bacterium]
MSSSKDQNIESPKGMPIEVLGMYLFIASEAILFLALLFIFYWTKSNNPGMWPPPDQPRLPLLITGINTVILLGSGLTMYMARRSVMRDNTSALSRWLMITCLLGVVFLTVQGFEWIRLIRFGLSINSSVYGAMFYIIIGLHAIHVLATALALLYVWVKSTTNAYSAGSHRGVQMCYMFWLFVVLIWPVLYGLVYLS